MKEIRDGRLVIKEPVTFEDIKGLKAGDVFYYDGRALTGRDEVHKRVVCEGIELPVDLSDKALLHAGPIIKKREDGKYECYAMGPTTSMRMEEYERGFIEKTAVRIIIGKGAMGEKTERACADLGSIHCVMPAGCAVVGAVCTEEVLDCYWPEFGMPEAAWYCRVKEIGPLIVTIDTSGHNFFKDRKL